MAASTTILTDLTSMKTTGPTAASTALAIAAAGPIQDLKGHLELAITKANELKSLLNAVNSVLDASDGIKTTLTNVLSSLS